MQKKKILILLSVLYQYVCATVEKAPDLDETTEEQSAARAAVESYIAEEEERLENDIMELEQDIRNKQIGIAKLDMIQEELQEKMDYFKQRRIELDHQSEEILKRIHAGTERIKEIQARTEEVERRHSRVIAELISILRNSISGVYTNWDRFCDRYTVEFAQSNPYARPEEVRSEIERVKAALELDESGNIIQLKDGAELVPAPAFIKNELEYITFCFGGLLLEIECKLLTLSMGMKEGMAKSLHSLTDSELANLLLNTKVSPTLREGLSQSQIGKKSKHPSLNRLSQFIQPSRQGLGRFYIGKVTLGNSDLVTTYGYLNDGDLFQNEFFKGKDCTLLPIFLWSADTHGMSDEQIGEELEGQVDQFCKKNKLKYGLYKLFACFHEASVSVVGYARIADIDFTKRHTLYTHDMQRMLPDIRACMEHNQHKEVCFVLKELDDIVSNQEILAHEFGGDNISNYWPVIQSCDLRHTTIEEFMELIVGKAPANCVQPMILNTHFIKSGSEQRLVCNFLSQTLAHAQPSLQEILLVADAMHGNRLNFEDWVANKGAKQVVFYDFDRNETQYLTPAGVISTIVRLTPGTSKKDFIKIPYAQLLRNQDRLIDENGICNLQIMNPESTKDLYVQCILDHVFMTMNLNSTDHPFIFLLKVDEKASSAAAAAVEVDTDAGIEQELVEVAVTHISPSSSSGSSSSRPVREVEVLTLPHIDKCCNTNVFGIELLDRMEVVATGPSAKQTQLWNMWQVMDTKSGAIFYTSNKKDKGLKVLSGPIQVMLINGVYSEEMTTIIQSLSLGYDASIMKYNKPFNIQSNFSIFLKFIQRMFVGALVPEQFPCTKTYPWVRVVVFGNGSERLVYLLFSSTELSTEVVGYKIFPVFELVRVTPLNIT